MKFVLLLLLNVYSGQIDDDDEDDDNDDDDDDDDNDDDDENLQFECERKKIKQLNKTERHRLLALEVYLKVYLGPGVATIVELFSEDRQRFLA